MPLRNGKKYLIPWICRKCNKFYGHKIYDYNCSHCTTNENRVIPVDLETLNAVRRTQLANYVKNKTIDTNTSLGTKIIQLLKRVNTMHLYQLLTCLRVKGKFLHSRDELDILQDGVYGARGHIIAAHVLDWWNIRTRSAGGEWQSHLVCYYGDFDSKMVPKFPPRPPRNVLSCTETMPILNRDFTPIPCALFG